MTLYQQPCCYWNKGQRKCLRLPTSLNQQLIVKFIYSEEATKFCEMFTLLLSYVVPVKSKVKISQNIVAFSEYMNFTKTKNNKGGPL